MTEEVTTTACHERGRFRIRNADRFLGVCHGLRDGDYIVTVKRARATRSDRANRWYWGVIVQMLADHTGYTPDEMHEVLKAKFIPKRFAVADGNGEIRDELVIGGSSARLNTVEFGEYCTSIQEWAAADLGLVIPDPIDARKSA